MIFDKIIGNPPYSGDLHLKIIKNTFKKLSKKSVWLHPARWVQSVTSPTDFPWLEKGVVDINLILDNTKTLFGGMDISGDLVITYLTGLEDGKMLSNINPMSLRSVFKNPDVIYDIYKKVISKMDKSVKDYLISDKPLGKYSVVFSLIGGQGGQGNSRISKIITRQQDVVYHNGIAPNGKSYKDNRGKGVPEKEFTDHLEFETEIEANNFLNSLKTVFMIGINSMSKCDMHVHPNVIPYMDDYKSEWNDERFYKYFNLSEEEIKVLEDAVCLDYPEYRK